jgi:hypothetical protein
MKRRIIQRVIVLLLLGATVNVAVAWGCAMWSTNYTKYEDTSGSNPDRNATLTRRLRQPESQRV